MWKVSLVLRAIALLRYHEPEEGYYLAFSGGKDSCVCKKLCQLAGVKFDAWYNNTTIDLPELIYFIKKYHPDVGWNKPKYGNMMHRVATAPKVPPTRVVRWCCQEYKEGGGRGRTKVFGVVRTCIHGGAQQNSLIIFVVSASQSYYGQTNLVLL